MKKKLLKNCFFLLTVFLASTFRAAPVPTERRISVEAPSPDPTLVVRGPERTISGIDDTGWADRGSGLFLFSDPAGISKARIRRPCTLVCIGSDLVVTAVVGSSPGSSATTVSADSVRLPAVPPGGWLLLACDDAHSGESCRRFLSGHFRKGDRIKFRIDGEPITPEQIKAHRNQQTIRLSPDRDFPVTVGEVRLDLTGQVLAPGKPADYRLHAVGNRKTVSLRLKPDGRFRGRFPLQPGTNYIDLILTADDTEQARRSLIVYRQTDAGTEKACVMWVEQFPNAKTLTSTEAVERMIEQVKEAGFTALALDVKGPEGYVSYRKNDLSHSPYLTATQNPAKQIPDTGFDLLETVLEAAHRAGLHLYASFNFFSEGNITTADYAVLPDHPDWEEIVQHPEDRGKLLKITESARGRQATQNKLTALAFVNPCHPEVQNFQLLRVEEVLKNYDIDGIILDRCRYDNLYADFSPVSRRAFEDYLGRQGKTLEKFPDDAFRIDEQGVAVPGKLYREWLTFRSQVICDFTGRVRCLVDRYREKKGKPLRMAAYVGSWYEVYYQNGVNWAGSRFVYDPRLQFPESGLYGDAYNRTSYLKYLDFLMIGTYYKTPKEINRYLTLGRILTNGEKPVIGSLSLPDLQPEDRPEVFAASLKHSAGLMIFDYCYTDWPAFARQMQVAFSRSRTESNGSRK